MKGFCVLVASAEDRLDIFDACFANSYRIWADCDWPRYLGVNSFLQGTYYDFKALTAPTSDIWSEQVARYIDLLPPGIHHVLLMVEDVVFMKPVDGKLLNELAVKMVAANIQYLRLVPVRRSWGSRLFNREFAMMGLTAILANEPYYSSTEMVIWRRDYLRRQLANPVDAWSFEHMVSSQVHWAVQKPVFDQHQVVQKGRWNWNAPRLLAKAGCPKPYGNRGYQTLWARLRGYRENLSFALFGFTSFKIKRWLRS